MKRFWIIAIPSLLIVCLVLLGFLTKVKPEHDFPYGTLPSAGDEKATVKIVEFGDYKCPACRYFTTQVFPDLKKEYIDTGKAEFHYAHFPFLADDSYRAATFAETVHQELGEEMFWKVNESLFSKQKDPKHEREDYMVESFLISLLEEFAPPGDVKKVTEAFRQNLHSESAAAQKQLGQKSGVSGTPSVFVNGKRVENPNDYENLRKAIEEGLTP